MNPPEIYFRDFAIIFLFFLRLFSSVDCQCIFEDGMACTWSNDESALLKWQHKLGIDGHFIELTKCKYPDCGVAIAVSPWMQPFDGDRSVTLQYKIYGHSGVYLSVHLKTVDKQQQHHLVSVYGDYVKGFPDSWSATTFVIPRSSSRYKIIIKANVPYREAYVAVKGISLATAAGDMAVTTSASSNNPSAAENSELDGQNENNRIDGPGNHEYAGNNDDYDYTDSQLVNELEMSQALEEEEFTGDEGLELGITTIIYPHLCKYR